MKRLLPLLVLCLLLVPLTVQACRRVVVRPGTDYVKVFAKPRTSFVIKDDIDLGGITVKIGNGSTLAFRGGSLSNGTVVGNNTIIKASNYEIFKRGYTRFRAYHKKGAKETAPPSLIKEYHNCLIIEGSWSNKSCGTNWTGLQNGSKEDVMLAVKNYVVLHAEGAEVSFPTFYAFGYESTKLPGGHVVDFNHSTICYPDNLAVWEDATIILPMGATACSMESGYGLISLSSNTTLKNLSVDGKSSKRQNEKIRLGVSCIISIGDAKNVVFENLNISNVLGPAMTAQSKAKDVTFRGCQFYNIGEHVIYSHQYLGYCHFEGCTFDTWDSERLSVYRNGLDYIYKHTPPVDDGGASYEELYRFELSFANCLFNNPRRVNSQGRTLGGFITGSFPVSVLIENSKFMGAAPTFNLCKAELAERTGKSSRMVVRGCDGTPYFYPAKSSGNVVAEYYDCVDIPFRTTYSKRYDNCVLFIDLYEDNIENVTPSFEREFSEPLIIKGCKLIDRGKEVKINHPIFHRPVVFENCSLSSGVRRDNVASIINLKSEVSPTVTFRSCIIDIPELRLIGGRLAKDLVSIEQCEIKSLDASH